MVKTLNDDNYPCEYEFSKTNHQPTNQLNYIKHFLCRLNRTYSLV
jgi:hypothetical protein